MIEKITSAQYTGYFSNNLTYIYFDEFREKKKEFRIKKILEEDREKVQEDREIEKFMNEFPKEEKENGEKRILEKEVKKQIIMETGNLINLFA